MRQRPRASADNLVIGWQETSAGMVRVGSVHYNTVEEIRRFGELLCKITASED